MHIVSLRRKHFLPFLLFLTFILVVGVSLASFMRAQTHALAADQSTSTVIQQVSSDPFRNDGAQHQTQVEPDTFSLGPMVVSAFQSGRFQLGGGASDISWVTSFDAGLSWHRGILPNLTVADGGSYARASDAVVAYDLAHRTWLISSLAAKTTFDNVTGSTVIVVSRSFDGLHWSRPFTVAASNSSQNFDKDWIVCDNHPASKFFGRCYEQWDDGARSPWPILMSYSDDGGLTWSRPQSPAGQTFFGQGGQPLVQPNGTVIVPIYGFDATGAESIYSFRSTNGGASWTDVMKIAPLIYSTGAAQFYRGGSLPSAEIDGSGKVYVAWAGCYFEADCGTGQNLGGTDDIVMTTTTDGLTWTPLQRTPLDPIGSGVEHLTAGLAVASNTSGKGAHLAVTYYYWPDAGCSAATCRIRAGMATSINGGATWSQHLVLSGSMAATWWANTDSGYMTGDYISTSIALNRAVTVVPLARAPSGQQFFQSMYGASAPVTGGSLLSETLKTSVQAPLVKQQSTPSKRYPAN